MYPFSHGTSHIFPVRLFVLDLSVLYLTIWVEGTSQSFILFFLLLIRQPCEKGEINFSYFFRGIVVY